MADAEKPAHWLHADCSVGPVADGSGVGVTGLAEPGLDLSSPAVGDDQVGGLQWWRRVK